MDETKPPATPLNVSAASAPVPVPVFNCIVHVMQLPTGGVRARVANLSGLECEAPHERAALATLVKQFKQQVITLMQAGQPIPWIEPPQPAEPGEQQRFIPVHL
jgi:hypothetical protein